MEKRLKAKNSNTMIKGNIYQISVTFFVIVKITNSPKKIDKIKKQ